MRALYPETLIGLLILVPLIIYFIRAYPAKERQLLQIAGRWRRGRIQNIFLVKYFFRAVFFCLFVAFSILALSGIQAGSKITLEKRVGASVAVAVDVSHSMLADDIDPSRMERAKEVIRTLISSLPQAQFSISIFTGDAVIAVPMTEDRVHLYSFLESLDTGLITAEGTDISSGIKKAASTFSERTPEKRFMILVTDGENFIGKPVTAAEEAAKNRISIQVLGAGTEEGSSIRLEDGSFLKDSEGNQVVTRLNSPLLKQIANAGGGSYFPLNDPRIINNFVDKVNQYEKSGKLERMRKRVPQYRLFITLAILFLFLYMGVKVIPWKDIL